MFNALKTRIQQGYHTMAYPDGPAPVLSERFVGMPTVDSSMCPEYCTSCMHDCPSGAVFRDTVSGEIRIDTGRCVFCRSCEAACPNGAIRFTREFQLAACCREDLKPGLLRPFMSFHTKFSEDP